MLLQNKIEELENSGANGIKIEICGSWIWVSGNTYPNKCKLKDTGFKYSKNKGMWYWHNGNGYRKHGRRELSIDKIRSVFGSKELELATS